MLITVGKLYKLSNQSSRVSLKKLNSRNYLLWLAVRATDQGVNMFPLMLYLNIPPLFVYKLAPDLVLACHTANYQTILFQLSLANVLLVPMPNMKGASNYMTKGLIISNEMRTRS